MKSIALLAALLLAPVASAAATGGTYHLAHTYVLGGDGGWDYLTYDAASKRLFVSRSTHVMVLDSLTGKVVGDVANTPGVHGIALAPKLNEGFTTNGGNATVTVFNLTTLATIATIQTASKELDGIAYDPASKRLFTFNGGSNDATVIDATTNAVIATIPLGGRPEFPAVDGRGMVYDNIESASEIVAIDAATAKIVARYPLGTCQHPSGLSIDATQYDAASNLAFASNGRDATLSVIHEDDPDRYTLAQNAATVAGARTMALDPSSGDVFLVTAKLIENPNATSYRDRYHIEPGTFELLVMEP
ncbi:MAG TPA: YncE family protein [Candidatus Baltobacteraceae bacterium]|nr:YncE family protein [Candidatus Baltobacteraceae bacterium]